MGHSPAPRQGNAGHVALFQGLLGVLGSSREATAGWLTFNTKSLLGGALLGQKKYADAEPLLWQGYEGMKERAAKIPPQGKTRLPEAAERLVRLYDAMDKKDEAAKWRAELEATKAGEKKP